MSEYKIQIRSLNDYEKKLDGLYAVKIEVDSKLTEDIRFNYFIYECGKRFLTVDLVNLDEEYEKELKKSSLDINRMIEDGIVLGPKVIEVLEKNVEEKGLIEKISYSKEDTLLFNLKKAYPSLGISNLEKLLEIRFGCKCIVLEKGLELVGVIENKKNKGE